jgi:DNA-binding Lrp family transcriptional regulator
MAQTGSSAQAVDVVRRHLSEIYTWRAQGQSLREMGQRVGLAKSTFHDALKRVEQEKVQAKEALEVDEGVPMNTNTAALAKRVYDGALLLTQDEDTLLPTLQQLQQVAPLLHEIQTLWPVLKTMATQWSEQQSVAQIPEHYQKYNAIYTVRLNDELVEEIKAYTKQHRLTQSEFLTAAVLRMMHRE